MEHVEELRALYESFKAKVEKNYNAVVDAHVKMPSKALIGCIYHLNFVNEWYLFLVSAFDRLVQNEELLRWLEDMESPIDRLYGLFLECDDAPHFDWDIMYEWLVTTMDIEHSLSEEEGEC